MAAAGGNELVTFAVAVLGSSGFTIFVREFIAGIKKQRAGVASKESTRQKDLVAAREDAEKRATEADRRAEVERHHADIERHNRYIADEALSIIRGRWLEKGLPESELPPRPLYESTLTREQIKKLNETGE